MSRVRAVFISDVHLGTRACQAERLTAFLRAYPAEQLYLVGDIIDFWAMKREVREEAGLDVTEMTLRGTVSWPGFNGRDVFGFVFLITGFDGEPPEANDEGTLAWHDVATIMDLPMWDGDRHFVPLVFDDSVPQFHGVIPYDGGHSVESAWRVSYL